MADEIAYLSVRELGARYAAKALSPREVLADALARIDRFEGRVNAFAFVDRDSAEAAAAESEARWMRGEALGPLDGIPATVKDIMYVKGWTTTYGSRVLALKEPASADSPPVARLREAGAILLGMTNTPEIGWKGHTDSPAHGITRNPWNLERTPGGSSGGAAVAAALGIAPLNIGTDGGGSIRIPASFTGLCGIKASSGRVPAWPASAFGSMAHTGPITRTVEDGALMLNALTRPDSRDWLALPPDGVDYATGMEGGIKGLRVAYSPALGYLKVDDDVAALVRKAAEGFAALGAHVEEVDPGFPDPRRAREVLWWAGAAYRTRHLTAEQRGLLDPGLRNVVEEKASALTLTDYMEAMQARAELGIAMRQFHDRYDLLLTPATPFAAYLADHDGVDEATKQRWTDRPSLTFPFNMTGQPAISVPCGLTPDGLPAGLQIVGRIYDDVTVMRAARAWEQAQPWAMPKLA
ncbi:MAG: amidase [Alphaproteobacteria bacterium]|nr:amidase [Alphaproteobacteria bacterium]